VSERVKVANGPDYYEEEGGIRTEDAYILSQLAQFRKIED
jgi:hypothetical protein